MFHTNVTPPFFPPVYHFEHAHFFSEKKNVNVKFVKKSREKEKRVEAKIVKIKGGKGREGGRGKGEKLF